MDASKSVTFFLEIYLAARYEENVKKGDIFESIHIGCF